MKNLHKNNPCSKTLRYVERLKKEQEWELLDPLPVCCQFASFLSAPLGSSSAGVNENSLTKL